MDPVKKYTHRVVVPHGMINFEVKLDYLHKT